MTATTHRGACHCGRVTFEVTGDIRGAMECNCSICHRKGALWHAAKEGQVRILSGESDGVHWEESAKALIAQRKKP